MSQVDHYTNIQRKLYLPELCFREIRSFVQAGDKIWKSKQTLSQPVFLHDPVNISLPFIDRFHFNWLLFPGVLYLIIITSILRNGQQSSKVVRVTHRIFSVAVTESADTKHVFQPKQNNNFWSFCIKEILSSILIVSVYTQTHSMNKSVGDSFPTDQSLTAQKYQSVCWQFQMTMTSFRAFQWWHTTYKSYRKVWAAGNSITPLWWWSFPVKLDHIIVKPFYLVNQPVSQRGKKLQPPQVAVSTD